MSTLGDFIWSYWQIQHRMVAGIIHGALLCLFLGGILGFRGIGSRSILLGALGGLFVGILSAGGFYLFRPLIRFWAMIVAWGELWVLSALLHRWVGSNDEPISLTLLRSAVAAIASGIAFYAISGIWTDRSPDGPNYAYHFLCWTIAFLPGFLALFATRIEVDSD